MQIKIHLSSETLGKSEMKKITLLLLILLGWLQYSLWFGRNGIHDFIRVKNDLTQKMEYNIKLKVRNNKLFAEINDLNIGQEAIEERVRNELGMIKPGETFYRLIPNNSQKK